MRAHFGAAAEVQSLHHPVRGTFPSTKRLQAARVRTCVVVHVASDDGVKDLLSRDLKRVDLGAQLDSAFAPAPEVSADASGQSAPADVEAMLDKYETSDVEAAPNASSSAPTVSNGSAARPTSQGRRTVKDKLQRRRDMAAAAAATAAAGSTPAGPRRCKEAIDAGLALFTEKRYQEAIDMFNLSLELPGNGAYRLPGSPREYSCPSDAEENAALYNMACAYTALGQGEAAFTCVEAILENGFNDFNTLQSDPDLAQLRRSNQWQDLLGRYTGAGGLLRKVFAKRDGPTVLESDDGKNKPWILW